MNSDAILSALDLPSDSHVDKRVPKKHLLENGARTAADKRIINDGIEELLWVAALKPATVGVPEYRDGEREYLEIAVLHLTLRTKAKTPRLVELVHRAVPYPLLLLSEQRERTRLSAAHKRWSQGEVGKTVIEDGIVSVVCGPEHDGELWLAFRDALALGTKPQTTLLALYQGWIDSLLALQAAQITGIFTVSATAEHATARRDALREYAHYDKEISRLRAIATKEKQVARLVELNMELKHAEAAQASARTKL